MHIANVRPGDSFTSPGGGEIYWHPSEGYDPGQSTDMVSATVTNSRDRLLSSKSSFSVVSDYANVGDESLTRTGNITCYIID